MEKKKSVFSTIANTFSKRLRSADSSQTPPPPPTKNFSNAPNEHSESGFIPTAMPLENKPEEAPKPTETEKRASLQAKRRENFGATADTGMRRMRQELRQAQAKEKKQQKTAQRRPAGEFKGRYRKPRSKLPKLAFKGLILVCLILAGRWVYKNPDKIAQKVPLVGKILKLVDQKKNPKLRSKDSRMNQLDSIEE